MGDVYDSWNCTFLCGQETFFILVQEHKNVSAAMHHCEEYSWI